jgi:hypothetical protein
LEVADQGVWRLVDAVEGEQEGEDGRDQDEHCEEARAAGAPAQSGWEATEPARGAVHGVSSGVLVMLRVRREALE